MGSPFSRRWSGTRLGLCVAALAVVAVALAPAAAGAAVPSTSASTYGTDGTVNAITTLGDTVYLGGAFENVGLDTGGGAATAASDGQADAAMPAVTGTVQAAVADGSGGFYIGGSFSKVGGVARANLAHILPDKSVDPSFNPGTNSTVNALALSGSTLYVGGASAGEGAAHIEGRAGQRERVDCAVRARVEAWIDALVRKDVREVGPRQTADLAEAAADVKAARAIGDRRLDGSRDRRHRGVGLPVRGRGRRAAAGVEPDVFEGASQVHGVAERGDGVDGPVGAVGGGRRGGNGSPGGRGRQCDRDHRERGDTET